MSVFIEDYFDEDFVNDILDESKVKEIISDAMQKTALAALKEAFADYLKDASFGCEFNPATKEFEIYCYLESNEGEIEATKKDSLRDVFDYSMFNDDIRDLESEKEAIKFGNYFKNISDTFFARAKEIADENADGG